jgi:hypothetical protein
LTLLEQKLGGDLQRCAMLEPSCSRTAAERHLRLQASDLDPLIGYLRAGVARKPPDILWREWAVDDGRPQVRLGCCVTAVTCIHRHLVMCAPHPVEAQRDALLSRICPLALWPQVHQAQRPPWPGHPQHLGALTTHHAHARWQENRKRPLVVYRYNMLAHVGEVSSFPVRMARPAWPGCYAPLNRVRPLLPRHTVHHRHPLGIRCWNHEDPRTCATLLACCCPPAPARRRCGLCASIIAKQSVQQTLCCERACPTTPPPRPHHKSGITL